MIYYIKIKKVQCIDEQQIGKSNFGQSILKFVL